MSQIAGCVPWTPSTWPPPASSARTCDALVSYDDRLLKEPATDAGLATALYPAGLTGAKSGGGWMLAEGPGEPAEGPATTGSGRLAFQPGDSRQAHPGLVGQFFLGQAALTA